MPSVSKPLVLSEDELNALENLKVYGDDEISLRARNVLACAEERTNKSIAEELFVTEMTVRKWKEAYRAKGLQGLESKHTGGRKSSSPTPYDLDNMVLGILDEYSDEKPAAAAIAERL